MTLEIGADGARERHIYISLFDGVGDPICFLSAPTCALVGAEREKGAAMRE